MLVASLLFAVMGACVKLAAAQYSIAEIVFYRSLLGVIGLGVFVRLRGLSLATRLPWMHLRRGAVGTVSLSLWFFSTTLLPLGTAFTFPCVTAMLSRVVSSAERGLYMGVQQTFGGITRVAFPIILGIAFDAISQPSPFWISAAVVLMTLTMGRDLEKYAPRVVKG